MSAVMLKFSRVRGGEYAAQAGDLYVEIDRTAWSDLKWQVFITRRTPIQGRLAVFDVATLYQHYSFTLAEAKGAADDFVFNQKILDLLGVA